MIDKSIRQRERKEFSSNNPKGLWLGLNHGTKNSISILN
jgi:hypothetical protein